MKALEEVKLYLERYQELSWEADISVPQETSLLCEVRDCLQWQNFTSEEKHEKRKFVFTVIKKMGNTEAFLTETTVIELYELVEIILSKLSQVEDGHLKTRLNAMLNVFVLHVNEQRDTRKMQTPSFELIANIAGKAINDSAFEPLHDRLRKLINLLGQLIELKRSGGFE